MRITAIRVLSPLESTRLQVALSWCIAQIQHSPCQNHGAKSLTLKVIEMQAAESFLQERMPGEVNVLCHQDAAWAGPSLHRLEG